jgi:hypothetical protein
VCSRLNYATMRNERSMGDSPRQFLLFFAHCRSPYNGVSVQNRTV